MPDRAASLAEHLKPLLVAAHKLTNPTNDDPPTLIMLAAEPLGEALAAWLRDAADQLAANLPAWSHKFPDGWEGDTPRPAGRPRPPQEITDLVEHPLRPGPRRRPHDPRRQAVITQPPSPPTRQEQP